MSRRELVGLAGAVLGSWAFVGLLWGVLLAIGVD